MKVTVTSGQQFLISPVFRLISCLISQAEELSGPATPFPAELLIIRAALTRRATGRPVFKPRERLHQLSDMPIERGSGSGDKVRRVGTTISVQDVLFGLSGPDRWHRDQRLRV